VAIKAEFAGLLPTQNPGNESKMPTFASPPYVGFGTVVTGACVEVVEPGTVVAGADVDVSESGGVLVVGMVVVSIGADVVSLVVESEQETAINDAASTNPTA
jgi:hypothetical protein